MTIDTTEGGLERLICEALTGEGCEPSEVGGANGGGVAGVVASDATVSAGLGWICGSPSDYDKEFCIDLAQLAAFLQATQPNPSQQLPPSRAVGSEGRQGCCGLGLSGLEEGCELC